MTKAIIGKPAPAFSGTAVLNGEFKELKLSDYLGTPRILSIVKET